MGWHPIGSDISSHLPFTPVVEANGFVFISGQASVDATGAIVSGTFEEEMRRSMANVESRAALGRADAGATSCASPATCTTRPTARCYNQLYREYFSPPFPARTTMSNVPLARAEVRDRRDRRPSDA